MSVLELARPEIRALQPYSSARMEASGGQVLLNANESPWPPPGDGGRGLNRYPGPQPAALVARLAALYGVAAGQVLAARGSDEAIDLLVRAFCRAGADAVVVCPPTFGMYAVSARVQGAEVIEAPLADGFALDADALLAAATPAVKLVFVCTPNNPTGGVVPPATLERLAAALRGRALLVVDEAYVEFAGTPSAAALLPRFDNLVVLRTLSKAWALAGARIGALLAAPEIVALLRRIMPPYPLPTPCVDAALAALDARGVALMHERAALLRAERARLAVRLAALPGVLAVLPSQANFLAVRFADAAATWRALLDAGIVVRDVGRQRGLAGCLRIGVGAPAENERLLAALAARAEAA
ncbi:histidinol phosphate aminotransferase apoenzyme [Mizugakiibacter sediminis]|uniref:Histidinol-phosphate aminotransferase n=1 Tax=Mizugakiibacter sediminis TaxID=1475481 RepID=A0A0K8QRE0_9GAMM|nr:histidinol-phosphate transaminase [Mizugakiibacter sediminis]GAP67465.1 histidinol phosphate aminotransferase apoenzyme [Mizugakiibacter sediminis]